MRTTCNSEDIKLWPFFEFVQKKGDKLSSSFPEVNYTLHISQWKLEVNTYRETSTFLVFVQTPPKNPMYWALCEVPWSKYNDDDFYLIKAFSNQIINHLEAHSDLREFEYMGDK
jgi:hypothetical protein